MLRNNYKVSVNIYSILVGPFRESVYTYKRIVGFDSGEFRGLFKIIDIGDKYRLIIREIHNNAAQKV